MTASGPKRHLVRRSDLVALGREADVQTRARNDVNDPERKSSTNCDTLPGTPRDSEALFRLAHLERKRRNVKQNESYSDRCSARIER